MEMFYTIGYGLLALLVTLMARIKRLSEGIGYFGIFLCALAFTPLPVFLMVVLMRARGKKVSAPPAPPAVAAPAQPS